MTDPAGRGERPARPLQPVALGLVVIALSAPLAGYDAFADPVGWALVLLGLRLLPADVAQRRTLVTLAGAALVVSVPLWLPLTADAVLDADPALLWALNLPQLGFTGLLCHVLATRAAHAADRAPARWLRLAVLLTATAAVAPVLVFGAGLERWESASYVIGALALLLVIALLLTWSGRPWAGVVARSGETAAGRRPGP